MYNDWNSMLEQMAKVNQQGLAAAGELNKIATRTQGLLAGKQLQALETCLQATAAQLGLVSDSRDPKSLVEAQVQMAATFGEKMVATAQESIDIQVQARDELARWWEDGIKEAQDSVQGLAPMTVVEPAPARPATRRRTKKAA